MTLTRLTLRKPRLTHSERRVNNSHLGESGCAEDSVVNPQVRMRNMSKNVSPSCKRVKAEHDCIEEIDVLTEWFLNYLTECREDCCREHVCLLVIQMACAALRFTHIADGRDTARNVLVAIRKIMEDDNECDDIEYGTFH